MKSLIAAAFALAGSLVFQLGTAVHGLAQNGIASNCQFTPGPVDDWDWTVTDPNPPSTPPDHKIVYRIS